MTSLKTSIKTITYLSDTGCLEIQGASLVDIDEKIRCSQLLQRIEAVNVERTKVFSRLTVLFCTPDRRSGQEMVLLDVDALRNVCEEFTAANSELLSLVQEYNRIAGSNGFDEIKIISRG